MAGSGVRNPGVDVRLPPALSIRDEEQAAVAPPPGLTHRFAGATGHGERRPARNEARRPGRRVALLDDRRHLEGRGVPGHIGVIPHRADDRCAVRVHPRCAIEVVPLGHHADDASACPVRAGAERDERAHRLGVARMVHLAHGQHPPAVRAGPEAAVVLNLPVRGLGGERNRRSARPVDQPHALVGQIDVGERTLMVVRHQAHGAAPVLVHPAANAHAGWRDVLESCPAGPGPHEDDPAPLIGPRFEPVERRAVRAEIRERPLPRRGLCRRER